MTYTAIHAAHVAAAILIIIGLKRLSSPETARNGNAVGAAGVTLAVIATLFDHDVDPHRLPLLLAAIGLGGAAGGVAVRRIAMTGITQTVALLTGSGGGAAAAVSTLALLHLFRTEPLVPAAPGVAIALGTLTGAISFSGSIVAWGKGQGLIREGAPHAPRRKAAIFILLAGALVLAALVIANRAGFGAFIVFLLASLLLGVLAALPMGAGDLPVVIPLLISLTGFAIAMTGFALHHVALILGGALVGAGGVRLTGRMGTGGSRVSLL